MRFLASRLLILGLVGLLTPGLAEATENLWHLATSGHSAHARDAGADHRPDGPEHGCSGTFHLCSCHHTPPTSLSAIPTAHRPPAVERHRPRVAVDRADPVLPGLFRPPQA